MNNETKKGKLVPELRFPGFEGEWEMKRLGEIADRCNFRNKDKAETRVLTNSATEGVVDQNAYFDKDIAVKENTDNYHIVDRDDFVYNPRISTSAPVGPISRNKLGRGIMSPLYSVFRFKSENIDYLEHFFSTTLWHKYLKQVANYGARFDRMAISTEDFYAMPIFVPSLPEQQKIAECLSSVDDLIQAEADQLQALKDHKKGLMQQLFPQEGETTPKLRFPGFEGEWEEKKLGEVAESFKTGKLDANAMIEGGKYRFYTCSKDYSFIDTYAFEGDCILIAGNGAHLGYVHHFDGKFNAYQRTYVLSGFLCESDYLEYCIRRFLPDRIRREKKEGNTPYIVLSTLTDMSIFLPPSLPEQQIIASCLSSLDEGIAAQQEKVEALKEHKKGLMQKLFPICNEQ